MRVRLGDVEIIFLIAVLYVSALVSIGYSFLTDESWALLFGVVLTGVGMIFHVAEALFTRE